MPRTRQRACLESGLKLDLNQLRRQGLVKPGGEGRAVVRWTYTYTGEEIANGVITSNMVGTHEGSLRIQLGSLDQTIILVPKPRNFGGYQWYFVCPAMNRYASVLWMPPGASRFLSRQAWDNQVAYDSQFQTRFGRACRGQAKIKTKLIDYHDPDDWGLPPKPKGMRWRTYDRYVEKFHAYGDVVGPRLSELLRRLDEK